MAFTYFSTDTLTHTKITIVSKVGEGLRMWVGTWMCQFMLNLTFTVSASILLSKAL